MFHKIKGVTSLPDGMLSVQFSEGVTKLYNITYLAAHLPVFGQLLSTPNLFEEARVDVGGCGIVWNDDIDLSCDELWKNGTTVPTPFDGLIALSDATELWGLSESALRKAIAYGKLVNGVDVCKYGKQWVISAKSMRREYGDAKRTAPVG